MRFLLIILIFFNILIADTKKIKIAIPLDMTPYSFVEEGSIPNGILIDFWRLWAKKNSVEIEFIPSTWQGTLNALKNKEAHIHAGLFKNEERAKYLEYIEPIYQAESHIYLNKELKKKINSIDDINEQTIGAVKGSFYVSFLKKKYPKLKIKEYSTSSKLFKAMENKEIDLLIEDSLIIQRFLLKSSSFNKVDILPKFDLFKWFYAAVIKDDKELEEFVRDGLKNISLEELLALEKKWVVKDKFKYLKENSSDTILTREEKAWISLNKEITIALTKEWIRYSYIDRDGKLKGFHLDLLNQMAKNLNINIKHQAFDSWSKAFNSAKEGVIDGVIGLSWSKEREEFFNYSPSYHYSPYYIVVRKDETLISSTDDFNNRTAVAYKDSITNKIIKSEAPNTKVINVTSLEALLTSVRDKKADIVLLESAKELDLDNYNLKIVGSVYTKYSQLAIGMSKNKKIAHSIIKKGIESISKEQMKVLKDKWLSPKIVFSKEELRYIKNSPPLKIGIEDWSGIMSFKDGKIEGIGGEIAKKALDISGLKFEYIHGDWDYLLKSFKEGKIEILPTTIYTKQRDVYGDFTQKYLTMKNYIYVKSNNHSIKSLGDLQNKKLAIQKDYGTITLIKEIYPNINIIETKNLEESIQKVLNGEVDALFELQIAVQNKMKEQLITNLKSIHQNEIKNQGLHIFLKDKDRLLKSILDKSLSLIPEEEKNKIISKWLYSFDVDKNVNVAFAVGRDPYILNKNFMKGIEYDLVNNILNLSSINIKNKKYLSPEKLPNIFTTNDDIDIAVSVKEDSNKLFYSDEFIEFVNVVVSRKSDDFKITNIKDLHMLKNKKIIAFRDAYKHLGNEYYKIFNLKNRPETYKEETYQKNQVKSFLKKETDLIILNKDIFKWFFYELGEKDISNYNFHYIFPKNNTFKVAFKDKNLRDIFNKNLKELKKTGEYDEIINSYTQGYIKAKVKINSLISLTVGKYIFENNPQELKEVIDIFTKLPYIKKIEIFDTHNKLLASNIKTPSKKFMLTDSYHFIGNLPQKVGFIKIYFDNKLLKKYENSSIFIPSIEEFQNLSSYSFIKEVYKKFNYINVGINFTKEELDFIKNKKTITFSNVNWKPMSIVDGDRITGLFFDYMKIIEAKTGLEFKYVKSNTWSEILQKFRDKKIDIIPNIGDAAFSFKDGIVTDSVVGFKYAIVSNEKGTYLDGLKDLKNKVIALPKGYSSNTLIKNKYPNIKVMEAKNVYDSLKMVSKNEVDAFVGHSAISVYSIQNDFPDLKIIGLSEEYFNHYILIQNLYPELQSIINKVIPNITPEERLEIKDRWVRTEVNTAIDYSLLYKIIAIFLIILAIILVFTKKLSYAKRVIEDRNKKIEETMLELEDSNHELETTIKNLKQTQQQLIESEKMASLAGLVAGVAHEINTPVGIGLTGSTHLSKTTHEIKKSYENDSMTQDDFESYLKTSNELNELITFNLKKAAKLVKSFKQVAVDQASEEQREFELKTYIDEILASIHSVTKKTNIDINIICEDEIKINSYPGAFSQILTNLIMNSIIHGYKEHEKGVINIEISKKDSLLEIIYTDKGRGIPKENIPKVFDPFFTTNRENGGSGLGLNIIYNIVTQTLNGKIKCIPKEKDKEGAEFQISFEV